LRQDHSSLGIQDQTGPHSDRLAQKGGRERGREGKREGGRRDTKKNVREIKRNLWKI
jgi:hypothetical protein